ncbi:MAG: recombinase family protein [Armatimonadetes bacterium]|nr:recombinase family protein [Armatimonadota bacterium]
MNASATLAAPLAEMVARDLTPRVAVSYVRVSTRDQAYRGGEAEGFSIPAQREANRRKAASLGAIVVKEFVDRGASAKTTNRPELQGMLDYIADHQVDFVIVHKVDRLARNRADDVEINKALDRAGVRLVSTTESIHQTPSGMLLHGIMSSIAEFYSRNLANEVTKGMTQKARGGGTNGRAPLGYRNIRKFDSEGREARTVVTDEERAPLIRQAFQLYATGEWTVAALADHLADRGLTTLGTPRIPSVPINGPKLNKLLLNPYYKGMVVFRGAVHRGKHEPLVDERTFQAVQDVLATHLNGERTRKHPHFLKGTVFCGACGSRLLVEVSKSCTGAYYPYFMCSGRHGKRNNCRQKAVLIDEVEARIEDYYERIALSPSLRDRVERLLVEELKKAESESQAELGNLRRQKEKLERQREKLMQAHYEDAVPLELLKREQERITVSLLQVSSKLETGNQQFDTVARNLQAALDLAVDCALAYKTAPDHIKKQFNQAFFKRILVNPDTSLVPELAPPFDTLLEPGLRLALGEHSTDIPRNENEPAQASGLWVQDSCGQAAFSLTHSLSKRLLVEAGGIEPPSETRRA